MEKLFTEDQLAEIQRNAELEFETYFNGIVVDGKSTEITIVTISKTNHLIFVEGNQYTGFAHLRDRHSYFSHKNYWTINDEKLPKLDNPSKFHPTMMPIVDYVKVADAIFSVENKNITKNHRPDLFDKYSGFYSHSDNIEKFHLLTYKNTKIVHTLFPDKKKHNEKRKCKFGKGRVTTSLKYPEGHNDLLLPYENEKGIVAYSILIRKYYSEKIERVFIQKHDNIGNSNELYLLAYRNFDDYENFDRETMHEFQYGDLTDFEDVINQIDDQTKNNCS
jgi:hypothetical protein